MISIVITAPEASGKAQEVLAHLVNLSIAGEVDTATIEWGEVKGVMHQPDSGERDNDMRNEALDEAAAIADSAHFFEVRDLIHQLKR